MPLFRRLLVPRLLTAVHQVGAKEVWLKGWERYADQFKNIRAILTARDPRDMYISVSHYAAKGKDTMQEWATPELIAKNILREFQYQKALAQAIPSMLVRYEDLCMYPDILRQVKEFAGNNVPDSAGVGHITTSRHDRSNEAYLHGQALTNRRVQRWRKEPNQQLVQQAHDFMERSPELCDFWGYSINAPIASHSS